MATEAKDAAVNPESTTQTSAQPPKKARAGGRPAASNKPIAAAGARAGRPDKRATEKEAAAKEATEKEATAKKAAAKEAAARKATARKATAKKATAKKVTAMKAAARKAAAKKATAKKAAAKKAVEKEAAEKEAKAVEKSPAAHGKSVAGKAAARHGSTDGPGSDPDKGLGKSAGLRRVEQPLMTALRAEHRHIAGVMKLFSEQLRAVETGQLVDTHVIYEIMDYMVSWPDRYHHPREDLIYGRVVEVDARLADSVDSLQREHDEMAAKGRELLTAIEGWREGTVSGEELVASGKYYVERMYAHMNSEEELVFPQIESLLTVEDWRELAEEDYLRPLSDPVFGPRVQREFRNLARKLRRSVRRTVERGTMAEWIGIEALMESLEVISMANDNARAVTSDHVRAAWDECIDLFRTAPLTAPLQCAVNNTRQTLLWLGEVAEISRDTFDDLSRVNQERLDRIRLLERA